MNSAFKYCVAVGLFFSFVSAGAQEPEADSTAKKELSTWLFTLSTEVEKTDDLGQPWITNVSFVSGYRFGKYKRYALKLALPFGVPISEKGFYLYDPQIRLEALKFFGWLDAGFWIYGPASKVSRDEALIASYRLWGRTDQTLFVEELKGWVELENRWWTQYYSTRSYDAQVNYTKPQQRAYIHEVRRALKEKGLNDFVSVSGKAGLVYSFAQIRALKNLFFFTDGQIRFTRTYGDSVYGLSPVMYSILYFYHGFAYKISDGVAADITIEHMGRLDGSVNTNFTFFGKNTTYYFGLNFDF